MRLRRKIKVNDGYRGDFGDEAVKKEVEVIPWVIWSGFRFYARVSPTLFPRF